MDKNKKQCCVCNKWKCPDTEFQTNGKRKLENGIEKRYSKPFCKVCESIKNKKREYKKKKKKIVKNKRFAETKSDRQWYAAQYLFDIWKPSKNILIT